MAGIRDARGRFAPKPKEALSSAYQKRIERAVAKGKSFGEARGHGTKPLRMWESQRAFGKEPYDKALEVLQRMRHGQSLSKAAKLAHTTPDAVRRYAGSALERDERGHLAAKPMDRLYRRMKFYGPKGQTWVEPANSKEASKLAKYHSAVKYYLHTGDESRLRCFKYMRLHTRNKLSLPFITDPDTLSRLASAGDLDYEDIYDHVA